MMDLVESRLTYREHDWHVIRPDPDDRPPLRDQASYWVCDSDSQRAQEWAASPYRFFFDFELLAADLPVNLGGHLHKLGEPWQGHPVGALVMTVYEAADTEVGVRVTFCVADEPHLQTPDGAEWFRAGASS